MPIEVVQCPGGSEGQKDCGACDEAGECEIDSCTCTIDVSPVRILSFSFKLSENDHYRSLELERRSQTGSSSLTPAARGPQSLNSRSATLQNGVEKAGASHSETTLQLGIGVLVVRHIHTTSGEDDSPLDETRVQFRFAHWFLSWGVMIAVGRDFGKFKITIRPHRLVRGDAPIFQACALGDDQAVAQLIQEGRASPFDTTSEGVTPLLVRKNTFLKVSLDSTFPPVNRA